MSKFKGILPFERPEIEIAPIEDADFDIRLSETWSYCEFSIGAKRVWGIYDQPGWKLTDCCVTETVGKAIVHGIDCTVARLDDYSGPEDGEPGRTRSLFIHSDDDQISYVAESEYRDGVFIMNTLYDDAFLKNYSGEMPRNIRNRGFGVYTNKDYNKISAVLEDDGLFIGAGVFSVSIDGRRNECLRVINLWQDEPRILVENYMNREGHSILFRRYNHPEWKLDKYKQRWDVRLPDALKLTLNEEEYVHWYDCLSDMAF